MNVSPDREWSGLRPTEVYAELADVECRWWICGGWAIDLWLGRSSRVHGDTDVGVPRDELPRLKAFMAGWEVFAAHDGELTPLATHDAVPSDVASLWCRRSWSGAWDLQVMIEEVDEGSWRFRRDGRITLPSADITWTSPGGISALKPEVQLLYKAKDVRERDQLDFDAVVPGLESAARSWLASALALTHPGHTWIERLR